MRTTTSVGTVIAAWLVSARRHRLRGDDGSLPMAMLVTIIGVTLSGVVASLTLTQIGSTRNTVVRADILQTAQTGLDVGVARIRAVPTDGAGYAQLNTLPCSVTGSGDGSAAGTATVAQYTVTITYYNDSNTALACRPTVVPAYAKLRSVGSISVNGQVRRRTLTATYHFQTTIPKPIGGQIHVGPQGATTRCLGVGSSAVLTPVTAQQCDALTGDRIWAYNKNLTISLVSTHSTSPMCMDTAALPHAVNQSIILKPCAAAATTGAALWRQQWSYNDNANFEGTSDGSTLDGFCFNAIAGNLLVLGSNATATPTCRQLLWDTVETFSPDNTVGGGAAPATDGTFTQLANFGEFGRCLDVPASSNPNYITLWPCKQQPNPANLSGNQRWVWTKNTTTGRGPLKVQIWNSNYPGGNDFCVWSPNSTAAGTYPDVQLCDASSNAQQWTVVGRVANSNWTRQQNYAASYLIKDYWGRCLTPAGSSEPYHTAGYQISRMKVADCDGSDKQKWNAPPVLQTNGVSDYAEE